MRSTAALVREHRVILKAVEALERLVEYSIERGSVPVGELRRLLVFLRTYVDRCHHGKEEGCLFPCLERLGVPREGGPIGVMLMEHEMGRRLVREIEERLAGSGVEDVVKPCLEYCSLIRQHVWKEDNILFPSGDKLASEEDDEANMECYEAVEESVGRGVHEEMERLADDLSARTRRRPPAEPHPVNLK